MKPLQHLFLPLLTVAVLGVAGCASPPPAPTPPAPASPRAVLLVAQTERGVQIVLPSVVLFDVGRAEFNADKAGPYLDRVAELLRTKTARPVAVEGHTDGDGNAELNDALSKARSKAVADALAARGLAASRLSTAGFSFNRPVASNATEEGKRLNRRVEIIVLDEKLETITAGEAPGGFESAWERLKDLVDRGLVKPLAGQS